MLSACAVGPDYHRPTAPLSAAYKSAEGWSPAIPADALDRGDWWTLFSDQTLNGLAARVAVSNQTIAAAEAAYRQARALVAEQRAALLPVVSLDGGATRSGGSGQPRSTSYRVSLGGTWEPDVWGRIRRTVEAARAQAQVSEADLAAARLSAQGELAADYFLLREADAEIALVQRTVDGYRRTYEITENRYKAGIVAHSDALQAETQLASTQSDLEALLRQRAVFEHAIAVLVGEAPGNFALPPAAWTQRAPEVPVGVPSGLLQRRPDIAAAERRVAAANAQIGVATAAFFPDITLSGSYGTAASQIGKLFSASSSVWSFGVAAAETIFDAGARRAQVRGARAAYDVAVANYRQTVLTALQDVEDQLTAAQVLARQEALLRQASAAADQAEQMVLNQYKAGRVSYVEVVTAQAAALGARRALVQTIVDRQTTAVALIQALGGGWKAP
ncbi:efflux transporter outer membrane subunit [Phenylobacterium sp.]|uniref:efflux transporter outer membrane subunit n=1 Tax=Phenylobacterium sp. TaxID=1871053 RepID=UPI002F4273DC